MSRPPKTSIVPPPSLDLESGTPRPPRPRKQLNDMDKLRERAKRAAAKARATVPVQLKVHREEYEALVGLCEKYHMPISTIARQCMIDGMRKYTEFSVPGLNPFPISPTRAFPEFTPVPVDRRTPADRARQAQDFQPEYDEYDAAQDIITRSGGVPDWALPSIPPLGDHEDLLPTGESEQKNEKETNE